MIGIALREWIRFYRQRGRIIGSLATPFLFLIFLGAGLGSALPTIATPQGHGYMEYFFPGNLLLAVLFTSIFSSFSLIEDRNEGFLQVVLVSPLSRGQIVAGKVLGGTIIAFAQGLIFLALAPLIGLTISLQGLFIVCLGIFAVSLTMTTVGFFFAWKFDSVQGFHSVMNLLLMPMWLLSGAFFRVAQAPQWLKPLMWLNPLAWGFSVVYDGLYWTEIAAPQTATVAFELLVVLFFGALFFLGSAWQLKQRRMQVAV